MRTKTFRGRHLIKDGSFKLYSNEDESTVYVQTLDGGLYSQTFERGVHKDQATQVAAAVRAMKSIEPSLDWVKM